METKEETKFRSNGIMTKEWVNGNILRFTFLDRSTLTFDRRLASAGNRAQAECHGWQQRLGDLGAVGATEFPDVKARSAEAKRRIERGIRHYQGPSSEWEIPTERVPSGPAREDLLTILERFAPGKGEMLLKGQMARHKDDVQAAGREMLQTAQFRKIWLDVQAERAAAAAEHLPSGDDLVAEMMKAAS